MSTNKPNIGILDICVGNILSVEHAFRTIGAKVSLIRHNENLGLYDALVIPGVGNFSKVMRYLDKNGWRNALHEVAIVKEKPILGICLGMQIFADVGEEGGQTKGLSWVSGEVKKLPIEIDRKSTRLNSSH